MAGLVVVGAPVRPHESDMFATYMKSEGFINYLVSELWQS